jgi:NTE family protein
VLEEVRVRPDLVVGTSMGAIVGGLYAMGYAPAEIEDLLRSTDWMRLFIDRVDREEKTFRRRQDDFVFLIPTKLRFKGLKPYLPPAALGGQRLELLLRSLEIQATDAADFDDLPIPFRAVAADLETGGAVVLDGGSVATAMRASMAVPGMLAPVEWDGRRLVDGGVAANLPVGIAQGLGAERVIAVDITSPLLEEEEIVSIVSVLNQVSSFSLAGNRIEDLARLRAGDILIEPSLGDITFTQFDRSGEAIDLGEEAARARLDDLRALAVDDASWNAFQEGHRTRPRSEIVIDEVRLENGSWVSDEVVRRRLGVSPGETYEDASFGSRAMRLHALDYFGTIRQRFERDEGSGRLIVAIPAKPYGRNSAQFGFSFMDDFAGETSYTLSMRHQLLAANRLGGEWENVGQVGDAALLRSLFYQPLDAGMRWFVSPGVQTRRDNLPIWSGGEVVAEYRVESQLGRLDGGRVLGDWGEARIGAFLADSHGEPRIGAPIFGTYDERDAGVEIRFRADTRDDVLFPRRGAFVDAGYAHSLESLGSDAERKVAFLRADFARTLGQVTLIPGLEGADLIDGPLTVGSSCSLGGFQGLSGLGPGELRNARCALGRLVAFIELERIDLGPLTPRLYGGISLEAGNVYAGEDPVTWPSLRTAGSIFFGAQSVAGPIHLGWGYSEGGRDRFYLLIGQRY